MSTVAQNTNTTLNPQLWVQNYADYLYSIAYYRTNKQEVAEDLVQDTFLAALNAKETYNGTASEKTWLTTILKNKIIDYYKKASTRNESPLQINSVEAPSYDYFFNPQKMGHWQSNNAPKDWATDGETTETKEFYAVLEKCLDKLPVKWRGVFTMSLLDDKETKHICKELDLSSSNFWVIVHRAKLQIRECLEKTWLKL